MFVFAHLGSCVVLVYLMYLCFARFLLLVKIVYLQSKRNQNSNLFGALEASVKLLSFQKFGAFLTLEKAFLIFLSFHSIF